MDKVLSGYKQLVDAVNKYVQSHMHSDFETEGLDSIYNALDVLAQLYGMDLELAATAFKESNDIPAHAQKLQGDDLVFIRIAGTLFVGLSEIGACIYDADQSLRTPEVIGDMLSTVLVLSEFEDA